MLWYKIFHCLFYGPFLIKKAIQTRKERIALIAKIVSVLEKEKINIILGDREFIGEKWLTYLHKEQIPFAMRVKKTSK